MVEDRGRSVVRSSSTNSISTILSDRPAKHPAGTKRATSIAHVGHIEGRADVDLRHAALRNGLLRTTSNTEIAADGDAHPTKTIPRASGVPSQWNTFTLKPQDRSTPLTHSASSSKDNQKFKSSISPLTHVHEATTPASNVSRGPDVKHGIFIVNRLEDREHDESHNLFDVDNKFEDTDNHFDHLLKASSKASSRVSRLYNRMSLLVNRRSVNTLLNSLVPMSRSESELESSDENEDDMAAPEREEPIEISAANSYGLDLEGAVSVLDLMKNLDDFQTSLISRSLPTKDATATRTQQKLLDMKDLIQGEKGLLGPAFGNLFDYSVKIQHEALMLEWTQIRLRFSSRLSDKSSTNISCLAGVLGFVQRYKDINVGEPTSVCPVTSETKDNFLHGIWQQEMLRLTDYTPPITRRSASVNHDDDADIYRGNSRMNMLSMARSVKLSRENTKEDRDLVNFL